MNRCKPPCAKRSSRKTANRVARLVERHAFIDERDDAGLTALMKAAQEGDLAWTETLLGLRADVNRTHAGGKTPLLYAAENGHADVVRRLAQAGAKIDVEDSDGNTPLEIAIDQGFDEREKILRELGATAESDLAVPRQPGRHNAAVRLGPDVFAIGGNAGSADAPLDAIRRFAPDHEEAEPAQP